FVDAAVATAEARQHLVSDASGHGAELIDTDVAADECREVAAACAALGPVGDIGSGQVHGKAADQPTALSGNEHLRRPLGLAGTGCARITVAVADGDDSEAARPRHREGRAVAHGVALRNMPYLDDPAFELDHRAHRIFLSGRRIDPVERGAWTNQVTMHGA